MTLITPPKPHTSALPLPIIWLGKLFLFFTRWKIRGQLPGFDKWMVVEYPHTSNWDAFVYVHFAAGHGLRSNWMVKNDWTKNRYVGWFFRAIGAVGVDRSGARDTVQQVVDEINRRDKITLIITPEGTRKHTKYLKAGFYWIAYHAKIPMVLATADYRTKEVILGPAYMATGDMEADLKVLFEWFKDKVDGARYPEKAGVLAVRPGSAQSGLTLGGSKSSAGEATDA
jgi:1-acyl-sn-glycerol-3-phosphate acyltransferase